MGIHILDSHFRKRNYNNNGNEDCSDPSGPLRHHQHHGVPHPPDQDGQDDQDEQGRQDGAPGHPRPEGHGRLRHRTCVPMAAATRRLTWATMGTGLAASTLPTSAPWMRTHAMTNCELSISTIQKKI